MATLASKLIRKAQQRCVSYYHLCTNYDDWGTLDTHWLQVLAESPAPGYLTRYFVRVNDTRRFEHQKEQHSLAYHKRGVMCVTFLRGEISDVAWHIKPRGRHANPLENYQHRDDLQREQDLADKPEGYGVWA